MRRFWILVVALIVSVPLLSPSAGAWEFGLKGAATYEYEMIGQTGTAGFFGPYDIWGPGGTHRPRLNFWPGLQPPGNINGPDAPSVISSSDARCMTQYAEFFPDIKINPAISLAGSMYIGAWTDPLVNPGFGIPWDSELATKESAGAHTSMSPVYVNWFRMQVQLPFAVLTIGKRPYRFGMGLAYEAYTAASESVSLSAPYGPFRIGWSFYPARRSNHGYTFYPIKDDGSNIRPYNFGWAASYSSGAIEAGFQVNHVNRWRPAERVVAVNNYPNGSSRERTDREILTYFKYNNGRFFFNAEFDSYWRKQLQYGTNPAAPTAQIYNDVEAMVYGLETGIFTGASKLSFLFVNATDDDRRAVSGGTDVFKAGNYFALSGELGNTFTVCRPYAYLMGFHYGGGLANGYDFISGIGTLRGRWSAGTLYGLRLDHAVAANLNVFLTAAKGVQWNKSYGWGYIGLSSSTGAIVWATRTNGANRSPAIPDDDLGWELGTGFDWKLLEGLTLSAQYSYWQPGNWWKFACVSRTNPQWNSPQNDTARWGTDPDRAIDAIYGVNVLLVGEF